MTPITQAEINKAALGACQHIRVVVFLPVSQDKRFGTSSLGAVATYWHCSEPDMAANNGGDVMVPVGASRPERRKQIWDRSIAGLFRTGVF